MTTEKGGRPLGRDYPHSETLRLTHEQADLLGQLAEEWGCSRSEVVRRLLERVRELRPGG